MQLVRNNSSGVSALSFFLEPLRDQSALITTQKYYCLTSSVPRAETQALRGGRPRAGLKTLSPPHYPGAHRQEALKWPLDTPGGPWGRSLSKGQGTRPHSPTVSLLGAYCWFFQTSSPCISKKEENRSSEEEEVI